MRRITAGFTVLLAMLGISMPAYAQTISTSQKITVTAVVPPLRYAIVNDHNQITEIGGNTAQNTTPEIFKNSILGPKAEITPSLGLTYAQIINTVGLKPGIAHINLATNTPKKLDLRISAL